MELKQFFLDFNNSLNSLYGEMSNEEKHENMLDLLQLTMEAGAFKNNGISVPLTALVIHAKK